ncbi:MULTISPECIES: hypothetical protein [unclassified Sinorhizobium]|uniref:hypothetical protein n=1 Tax=unclassified Sinorhizobium TaxID=2613772 RepID=UPI0024C41E62|nr:MULTISPECIES: hypothetical protein [unclassified Sinorhizobium]MDK1374232.1 hypothetical protein [Sinorhizobium sp. 6-70]MDK1481624.1 hypothetical protein [Sinorhizobium sp. 6-117]
MTSTSGDQSIPRQAGSLPAALGLNVAGRSVPLWCALSGAAALLGLAIFARVMSEAIGHDEQIYMGAGALIDRYTLYQDVSYAHFPNLPILLSLVVGDSPGYHFLAARFTVFLCWMAFLGAFGALSWRLSKSLPITVLAILLIVSNPLFIDHAPMLVASHLFPVCLATFGFLFFVLAMERERRRSLYVFLCGASLSLAVGFKVNYVIVVPPFVVAAFLLPRSLKASDRLRRVVVPMALGGLIAGLPSIYYFLTHTDAFLFNTVEYFTGPHRAYWNEPARASTVTGLSLRSRIIFAYQLWGTGASVVILVGLCYCFAALALSRDRSAAWRQLAVYPVPITLALTALGVLISFVVKPAFPQYYMPPIPFMILLLVCLLAAMTAEQRQHARPLIAALAVSAFLLGAPQLLQDLPKLAAPSTWTGIQVHNTATRMREHLGTNAGRPRVATLSPIYAIDAGLEIYPQLASGPFFFRVGDYLSPEQRAAYNITSPSTVHVLFDAAPPDAILIGHEGELDEPLKAYALAHGYVRVPEPIGTDRYGGSILYVRPVGSAPAASEPPAKADPAGLAPQ